MRLPSPVEKLCGIPTAAKDTEFYIKRDDLIDIQISGNKWRKLQRNLLKAREQNYEVIATFGGAYSNHIAATAKAGNVFGFKTVGIIRGEEHLPLNPTLAMAVANGMQLMYMDRERYRQKASKLYHSYITKQYGPYYLIPEGGANAAGVEGCMAIMEELNPVQPRFNHIFLAAGTGTTAAGLALAASADTKIKAVSALKNGSFLKEEIFRLMLSAKPEPEATDAMQRIEVLDQYDFGGYAKCPAELLKFMRDFTSKTSVKLDPVYTAKAAFAMMEYCETKKASGNVLLLHTGGLQGIEGFEQRHKLKIYEGC